MFIEKPATKISVAKRKTVYGVGINDADYVVMQNVNGKQKLCPFYQKWKSMLNRCYSSKYQENFPTYINCSTCKEWLTFSNFKKWMIKQEWQGSDLDKDIKIQGNKLYSPETCLFVPQEINKLLTDSKAIRGSLPQGVHKKRDKYASQCNKNGKRIHLGYFESAELAFEAYKEFKYNLIRLIAETQSEPLRSALLNYRIT